MWICAQYGTALYSTCEVFPCIQYTKYSDLSMCKCVIYDLYFVYTHWQLIEPCDMELLSWNEQGNGKDIRRGDIAYFTVLSRHLPGGSEEDYEERQNSRCIGWKLPIFCIGSKI